MYKVEQSGRAKKGAQVQEQEVAQLLPLTVPEVRRLRLRGWCGKFRRRLKGFCTGLAGAGDIKPEPNKHISNGEQLALLPKCGCSISAYPNNPHTAKSDQATGRDEARFKTTVKVLPFPSPAL